MTHAIHIRRNYKNPFDLIRVLPLNYVLNSVHCLRMRLVRKELKNLMEIGFDCFC